MINENSKTIMKINLKKIVSVSILLITIVVQAQITGSNLILHLDFNNNSLSDKSNYNHNIINHNANFSQGIENSGLNLNGTNSYLEVSHSSNLEISGKLTISLWYKYTQQNNQNSFYSLVEQSANEDGGHSRYGVWLYGNQLYFCIEPDTCPNSLCQRCVSKSVTLTENNWYHIMVSYDRNTLSIYLDNQLVIEQTYSESGISVKPYPLTIGTDIYDGNPVYLKGVLDEIQLYDIALNSSQRNQLFNQFATAKLNTIDTIIDEIYPIPSKNRVKIKSSFKIDKIFVLNINGKLIGEYFLNRENQINIESLKKGVYIFRFHIKDEIVFRKFIKN